MQGFFIKGILPSVSLKYEPAKSGTKVKVTDNRKCDFCNVGVLLIIKVNAKKIYNGKQ